MKRLGFFIIVALAQASLVWAGARLSISWESSNSTDVAGYRLYINSQLLEQITIPTATSWSGDCPACVEGNNTIGLTAFDSGGQESEPSTRVIFFDPPPRSPHIINVEILE